MKAFKWLGFAGMLVVLCARVHAAPVAEGEDELIPPSEKRDFDSTADAMGYGLGRGAVNLTLGVIEIPRNFTYQFTRRPLSGIITAPMMGATLTAARAVFGCIDLLSLGYNGYYDYGADIPDYPWDNQWFATETEME
jgi:hypothetical protein